MIDQPSENHDDVPLSTGILLPRPRVVSRPAIPPSPFHPPHEWSDWHWQMRNRIRNVKALHALFKNLGNAMAVEAAAKKFPLAITPYYASLIRTPDESDPIFRMCVPDAAELFEPPFLRDDPLEEEMDMPVPGLVHRYKDRCLLIATTTCAAYCRHCTRKRVAGVRETCISALRLRQVVTYLRNHPEVNDVIVSGGDPLTMSTEAIERVLEAIRSVPSVSIIRIGTRVPVVMPQRITQELASMLKRYHPIWINTHFNHPNEITPESTAACEALADAGIPLGNQTVLLRGVNDNAQTMMDLCRKLVSMRVRPYYLFQCDLVRGVEHFRTPISRGIEIMEYLRGRLSGFAIPSFIVDAPHGGGKIPVLPNYILSSSPTHTVIRNYEGMLISYPEPRSYEPIEETENNDPSIRGVWGLASGQTSAIQPKDSFHEMHRLNSDHTSTGKRSNNASRPRR